MITKLLVGLDGHSSGERALAHGQELAALIANSELIVAYVVEWSPFSFQTPEENAERHKRRLEEIKLAQTRIIDPAIAKLKTAGVNATGVVRHGNVADTLDALAKSLGADMIIVGRRAESGIGARIFGSSASNLVMQASVPVTVVN